MEGHGDLSWVLLSSENFRRPPPGIGMGGILRDKERMESAYGSA